MKSIATQLSKISRCSKINLTCNSRFSRRDKERITSNRTSRRKVLRSRPTSRFKTRFYARSKSSTHSLSNRLTSLPSILSSSTQTFQFTRARNSSRLAIHQLSKKGHCLISKLSLRPVFKLSQSCTRTSRSLPRKTSPTVQESIKARAVNAVKVPRYYPWRTLLRLKNALIPSFSLCRVALKSSTVTLTLRNRQMNSLTKLSWKNSINS